MENFMMGQEVLGYTYFKEEKYALTTFWGLILPMGGKPTGEYLFDTNLGSNGHSGIVSGASLMFRIWHKKDKSIFWLLDTTGTFFAENKQMRSLDLVGKPWSRYLSVYKDRTKTTTSPGINNFTQLCDVSAGSTRNLNLGLMFNQGGLRLSAGYHFHSRDREIIELSKDWSTDSAVAAIFKDDLSMISTAISKNGADIKNYRNVLNDKTGAGVETYKPLTQSDLDLDSASAPASTVHTLYAGLDYYWPDRVHPLTLGFGGSYDAAGDNASLDRFLFWARLGINF